MTLSAHAESPYLMNSLYCVHECVPFASIFQVVSTQHALTIVAMEKKLVKAMAKISSLETTLAECQLPSPSATPGSTSQPSPTSHQTNRTQSTVASDEGREEAGLDSLDGGPHENGQHRDSDSQQAKMRQLEEDLSKVEQVVQVLRYVLYTHVVCAGVWSRKRVCMCCLCWGMVKEESVHVLSVLGYGQGRECACVVCAGVWSRKRVCMWRVNVRTCVASENYSAGLV